MLRISKYSFLDLLISRLRILQLVSLLFFFLNMRRISGLLLMPGLDLPFFFLGPGIVDARKVIHIMAESNTSWVPEIVFLLSLELLWHVFLLIPVNLCMLEAWRNYFLFFLFLWHHLFPERVLPDSWFFGFRQLHQRVCFLPYSSYFMHSRINSWTTWDSNRIQEIRNERLSAAIKKSFDRLMWDSSVLTIDSYFLSYPWTSRSITKKQWSDLFFLDHEVSPSDWNLDNGWTGAES